MSLSEEHELQIQAYLRFAKLKRDQHVREFTTVQHDFQSGRIRAGDMYNYQELKDIFTDLESETSTLVTKEIQNAYHTNALLVKLLLSQAQESGVELLVDTAQLENELLLRAISASEVTALRRPASDFKKRNSQLSKLGTIATVSVQDPLVVKERDALKGEVESLQERVRQQGEQVTAAMRERTEGNEQTILRARKQLGKVDLLWQVRLLGEQLAAAREEGSSSVGKLQRDLSQLSTASAGQSQLSTQQAAELQRKLQDLSFDLEAARAQAAKAGAQAERSEGQLAAAKEGLDGKLTDCKQYQQMKGMMQAKSAEVVALRKRLAAYEPQDVPSADAQ
ncbi:MAG: hypothetical protein WDW36_008359 [Sanguina aurantia]